LFKVGEVFDLDDAEMGESLFNSLVLGIGASEKELSMSKFELIDFVIEGVTGGIKGDGGQAGAPGSVI